MISHNRGSKVARLANFPADLITSDESPNRLPATSTIFFVAGVSSSTILYIRSNRPLNRPLKVEIHRSTQSPSLSNNPKILTNYLICTESEWILECFRRKHLQMEVDGDPESRLFCLFCDQLNDPHYQYPLKKVSIICEILRYPFALTIPPFPS